MLWVGSGCHYVCAWECVRWMLLYLFPLLTQVLVWLLAGYYRHKWLNFTLPYSLYRIFRKSDTKQNVQLCILFNKTSTQVMAWHRIDRRLLQEPMVTKFIYMHMHVNDPMSWWLDDLCVEFIRVTGWINHLSLHRWMINTVKSLI